MRRPVSEEVKQERRNELKKTLKGMIAPAIILLIFGIAVYVIMTYQAKEVVEDPIVPRAYDGGEDPIILENDMLKLTMDPLSTQFEVEVKASGRIWRSNPEDASSDPIAQADEKGKLQSTLLMTYGNERGMDVTYDNYSFSIENGVYEIAADANQIRIDYSLGKIEKSFVIPPVTTDARFQEYLAAMDPADADLVKSYYKKYDINKLGKKDDPEELLASYPILETEVIWVLRSTTKENLKKKMEVWFEGAGYTYDQYLEDKELDNAEKTNDNPVFNLSVIYRLEGDNLIAEVPFDSMEYQSDSPIYSISLLPYFGASGKADEGFLFVPEGSGAIINFNNGKKSQQVYYTNLYGRDYCITKADSVHEADTTFNVFGASYLTDSYLCTIEEGSSYAGIQANISGKSNSYNYVNAVCSVCPREKFDVGDIANSDIYEYLWAPPQGESLVQKYHFIDSGSYVDMAKTYGEYLAKKYNGYFNLKSDTTAPVSVEIVGSIQKAKQILGIPVERPLALTTFDEAGEMLTKLVDAGFTNMSARLVGWCNGGVDQRILKKVKVLRQLGGKSGLQELSNTAKNLGVDFYLNGVTMFEYDSDLLDGFFSYTDAAKLISKERAEQVVFSAITYAARDGFDTYYLLHAGLALELAQKLSDTAKSYGANVAFEDIGYNLASDFYRDDYVSREANMNRQTELLKSIKDSGQKIMTNLGNDYSAYYSDVITNVDFVGGDYTILDANIPFLELARHGYVTYTSKPINICGNVEQQLLMCAEYGSGLNFTLMDESAFTLQDTFYTEYYGSTFDAFYQDMVDIYTRYNRELGSTFNQEMVNHEKLSEVVACTSYQDGTKVYVNYGYETFTAPDGTSVPARDYKVVK